MKIKNTKHLANNFSIFLFALSFLLFLPRQASAEKVSLGVYPPLLKIKINQTSHINKKISITNYGDTTTRLSIYIKQFSNSKNRNGQIKFISETDEVKKFITENIKIYDGNIPINQVLLSPKQQKYLDLKITIPKKAGENDYYLSILFISNNTQKTKSNVSFISNGIGINILLSILKQEQEDFGYIKNFSTPLFIKNNPVPFILEIGNQGNHYFSITGDIKINNILFRSKDIITLQRTNVLTNSSRFISDRHNNGSEIINWHPQFIFGIYRADLSLKTDNNKLIIHKSIYFYSYPEISLGTTLLILFFLGIVLFKIRKK